MGFSVPLGQKCPAGQISLPGNTGPANSTCMRKEETNKQKQRGKKKVLSKHDLAQNTTETGSGKGESFKFSATETKCRP